MSRITTRIWHGLTLARHAEEYLQYLQDFGIADYKKTPGNLGVQVLYRQQGDTCHFWTVTRWDSYESIKQFAGDEYEKAHYYPEDEGYLLEFEPTVIQCETFEF